MITNDILRKEIWWVLQELQKEDLARSAPEELICFEYQNPKTKSSIPSWNDQRLAINILENKHAIEIIRKWYGTPILTALAADTMGIKPSGIYLDILQPKFDEVYEEYKKACNLQDYQEAALRNGKDIKDVQAKEQKSFPHKLPAGTTWENVIIKFLDDEYVLISIRGLEYSTDYKQMGFEDSRGKGSRPNFQWIFLKVLAKVNGELTIKDSQAKDRYKKQKELLSKSLQSYFKIDYDPFYPYRPSSYKAESSYKIKITLIPPPESETTQNKSTEDIQSSLDKQIKEYPDEEAPEVYEEKQ